MTRPEQSGASAAARIQAALERIEAALGGLDERANEGHGGAGEVARLKAENEALRARIAELQASDVDALVDRLAGRLDAAIGKLDHVLRN